MYILHERIKYKSIYPETIAQHTSMIMVHVFSVEAMVCGYHNYQKAWNIPIGEVLSCEREVGNIHKTFAVAITKYG